ncbi:MAG: arylamine N-acetyltransferase [Acidimicrobiia bacterium]
MDWGGYLDRIGVERPVAPDLATLELLQRQHLTAVPFENLDVFYRRGVQTADGWSVPKIVERGRGGWCFELNGAFAALLTELGYRVKRLAATVLYPPISPMPTHLALEVQLERPYLVDVGFGDSFIRPLALDSEGPHDGGIGDFGFLFENDQTTLVSVGPDSATEQHYRFLRRATRLSDFDEASTWLQTAPDLSWTKSRFATRLIEGGPDRVTLLDDRIKFRREGEWTELPVSEDQWPGLLDQWFGMSP